MVHLALPVFLALVSLSHSEDNSCYSGTVRGSECSCQNPQWSLNPEEYGARLTCIGGDALHAAIEVKKFKSDLDFVKLAAVNGSLEALQLSDLTNLKSIRNLNLSSNKISVIDLDAFDQQNYLVLDLSFNRLAALKNKTFKLLPNLRNLSLSYNKLDDIEVDAFLNLKNLIYLDISNNKLAFVEENWFANIKNLHHLKLDHNHIKSIANNSFGHLLHLQRLDLSFNKLKILPNPSPFYRLKNLKYLSLAMNELTSFDEGTFKGNSMLDKVDLIGNNWICDKKLLPLKDWLRRNENNRGGAICSQPLSLQNYSLPNGLEILYLELKIDECYLCNATMCDCTIARDKLIVTVDCSSRGFTHLPEVVPYMTKAINLHNNNIKSLSIDHIDVTLWTNVSFLYLNSNIIDSLKGFEGSWLLRNLVALHLSNNHMTEIPIHVLEQFRGGLLDELHLSGNPWTCDCNTVRFQTWLQDNYRSVRNFDGICCSPDSGIYANLPIYRLKKSELCPQQVQPVNYLDVLNGIMAISILLLIVKLSYDYWLQKRTGKLPRFFSLNLP